MCTCYSTRDGDADDHHGSGMYYVCTIQIKTQDAKSGLVHGVKMRTRSKKAYDGVVIDKDDEISSPQLIHA